MAWGWLKQLFSFVEDDTSNLDEENRIIEESQESDTKNHIDKEIGVVTFVQNGTIEINKIWVASENTYSLRVGSMVSYCKPENEESNVVTEIELLHNFSQITNYKSSVTFEGVVCFVDDEKILVNPGSLLIWRDDTEITFSPESGDCIKLETCNDVFKLYPRECQIVTDEVKEWDGKHGFLKNNIRISAENCEHFIPKEGDRVISSIIPCSGVGYHWRSLILAKFNSKNVRPHKKIHIENIPVFVVAAGKEKVIKIVVKNISFRTLEIINVQIKPILENVTLFENSISQVQPGGAFTYKICCNGTKLGWSNFDLHFKFKTFSYYKNIKFLTAEENPEQNMIQNEVAGVPNFINLFKRTNFLKIKPKNYEIPSYLVDIYRNTENDTLECMSFIQKRLPELRHGLIMETYAVFFHTLLFLQELEEIKQMDALETVAPLVKRGQYYIFTFEKGTNYSNLFPGDIVEVSNPWVDGDSEICSEVKLCWKTENEIYLHFKDLFNIIGNKATLFRLKFRNNRTCTIRKHHAIDYFLKHIDVDWLFPNINTMHSYSDGRRHFTQSRNRKYFLKGINEEQKDAVENIVFATDNYNYPYLIFGPPGTGKTYTLVEITLQTIRQYPDCRILISAPSNSAVDTFCTLLLANGTLSNKELLRLTSFHYAQQDQLPVNLLHYSAISGNLHDQQDMEIRTCDIASDVFKYKVIAGTLNTLSILNCVGLENGYFTHVFVDEAGQTTEPETLLALATIKPGQTRIVLSGDPNQLGPVITSAVAKQYQLGESLMLRLMSLPIYSRILKTDNCLYRPKTATALRKNYRALPQLVQLTSDLFYNSKLVSMLSENSREFQLLNKFKKTRLGSLGSNLIVINVIGVEEVMKGGSHSYWNSKEATRVSIVVLDLLNIGISTQQIGIITPYSQQVKQIRQCFNFLNIEPPKIGTVEEFQGSERDFIIISLVRTTIDECKLSFISDSRRANVALSRAKAVNIIIAKEITLKMSQVWEQVLSKADLIE